MKNSAACFDELRAYCDSVPLVDCHDHSGECGPKYTDPIQVVTCGYFPSDLLSASSEADMKIVDDTTLSIEERWQVLERIWNRTCHTGYARVTRLVLKQFYGEDRLSLDALRRMQSKLLDLTNPDTYDAILEDAHIKVRLADIWPDDARILDGSLQLAPRSRLVISLPKYHSIRSWQDVQNIMAPLKRTATSLDEYIAACRELFDAYKRFGAVAFKDQSAYTRSLLFGNPARQEAEIVFNRFIADPRYSAGYPDETRPLDDFLFHAFMRMARDLDLPVQIHTGHMAGVRNDIVKTNAVLLTPVLELHRDVRFDLFHANWPYSAELLFLAKNYPNVSMDFCWANIIDPVYCQNLFKQALSSVPHGKIHGYGSDFVGNVDRAWAHAHIARDNIAIALAEMVEMDYLDCDDAKQVAYAWLFGNANEFFRLGC